MSRELVGQIKDRIRIESLFGNLVPSGPNFKALCPFHDDHSPSLVIRPDYGTYRCFACGAAGDVLDYVQYSENVDFPEAVNILAERLGLANHSPGYRSKTTLYATCDEVAKRYRERISPGATRYLTEDRKLSREVIAKFGVGLAHRALDNLDPVMLRECGIVDANGVDRIDGRVAFPIRDRIGRTIGFAGRLSPVVEQQYKARNIKYAKYINTPETRLFKKRNALYGQDMVPRGCEELFVVEGYFDVLGLHSRGISCCVGAMSASVSPEQLVLARRLSKRIVLVFDGDDAGRMAIERNLPIFLAAEVPCEAIILPEGVDPGDCQDLGFDRIDPLEYVTDRISGRYPDTPDGARQAASEFARLASHVPFKGALSIKVHKAVGQFAQRVGVDPALIYPILRNRAPAEHVAPQYDPFDRELLACLVNNPAMACTHIEPSDPILSPLIRAVYEVARTESPTPNAVMSALEADRTLYASFIEDGDWEARSRDLVRGLELRDARRRVENIRGDLTRCTEDERLSLREGLASAIRELARLEKA